MPCHKPFAVYQLLNGVETIGKIVGIGYRRNIAPHFSEGLCKGTSAQLLSVKREVDVIKCRVTIVGQHRRNYLSYIRHLTATAHNNRSRCNYLLTVGILLGHRQRVFSRRNIHADGTTKVAQRFYRLVKTCVFAGLRSARPHPVGRKTNATKAF